MTTWVLLAGLPGTGKSTLAGTLKGRQGSRHAIAILNKDQIREAIFSAEFTDYSSAQDELCSRTMIEAAGYLTSRGAAELVIFDGRTFSRRSQREEVIAAAEASGARWRIVHLVCPPEVAESRIAQSDLHHPAKNRGIDLYRRISREFEPIDREHLTVDSTAALDAESDHVWRYLSGSAAGFPERLVPPEQ